MKKLEKLCLELGVTLCDACSTRASGYVTVYVPHGKQFGADGSHHREYSWGREEAYRTMTEATKEVIDFLSYGVADCECEECGYNRAAEVLGHDTPDGILRDYAVDQGWTE